MEKNWTEKSIIASRISSEPSVYDKKGESFEKNQSTIKPAEENPNKSGTLYEASRREHTSSAVSVSDKERIAAEQQLIEYGEQCEIKLTEVMLNQFRSYHKLLCEWNQKMNLTAITQYDEVVKKHFIDSLLPACEKEFIDCLLDEGGLIDVGSGAGFPGLPLKLLIPKSRVVLLDSLQKRVRFLNTVIEELQLEEITAVSFRAEDAARKKEYREQFAVCVSRAVASLSVLSEYCLPFVKQGGLFVAYKAQRGEQECREAAYAIKCLGGELEAVKRIPLADTGAERQLYFIRKVRRTEDRFPRKSGKPSSEPLCESAGK